MKKNLIIGLLILVQLTLNSQSIKAKKGNILYDDKVVGFVESKNINNESNYTFSDTTRKVVLTAVEKWYKYDPAKEPYRWLVFENADKTKKTELPIEFFRVFFTNENNLTKTLGKELHLFDANGFNTDTIRAFFEVSRPSLTAKYLGQKEVDEKMEVEGKKNLDAILPLIASDNRTIMGYGNSKPIGFVLPIGEDELFARFNIVDLDNQLVATIQWTLASYTNALEIKTYKGRIYNLDASRSDYQILRDRFYKIQKGVELLILKGFLFQHQIIDEKLANDKANIAQKELEKTQQKELRKKINSILQPIREKNTGNIYGKKGFAYFGNDDFFKPEHKVVGTIDFEYTDYNPKFKDSISFELLSLDTIKSDISNAAIITIDPYQNTVDGKVTPKKSWMLEARARDKFCIETVSGLRCFEGIKTQAEKPYFYEKIESNQIISVFIDPHYKNNVIFRLNEDKNGIFVSNSTQIQDLIKYLKKYPLALEEIKKCSSSNQIISNIKTIIQHIN